eukprot:8342982-Lingulodinium_polyedra.AAC.1
MHPRFRGPRRAAFFDTITARCKAPAAARGASRRIPMSPTPQAAASGEGCGGGCCCCSCGGCPTVGGCSCD